jgi:hypothetical protein
MRPDVEDYPERGQPIVIQGPAPSGSIWAPITRAVVSFTLLAVLLLAFGVAIAGWFIGTRIKDDLTAEIDRTPVQAQMVIAYRDALMERTERMADDRVVLPPPDPNELYGQVMDDRGGRGGLLSDSSADNLQAQIDLLQRDNADLRWANQQLRQQAATLRNPPVPERNQMP